MLHLPVLLSHNISVCLSRIENQLQTCIELQTYIFCYSNTCAYIPYLLAVHTNQLIIVHIIRIFRMQSTLVNRDEESNSEILWTLQCKLSMLHFVR